MKISASEMRAAARRDLKGRWSEAALLTFVYMLISLFFGGIVGGVCNIFVPAVGSLLSVFVLIPMSYGYACSFLALSRGEEDPFNINCLFRCYKDWARLISTLFLQYIYIVLWTLLLIIPGIIKTMSYSMTIFILRDYPELKNNDAIELSMAMMDGHKWELFVLYLTFIGWGLLCIFTLGIGYFWLEPYMISSMANFYQKVKAEYESK